MIPLQRTCAGRCVVRRRRLHPTRARAAGFTFMELVMVILIIALVSVSATGGFASRSSFGEAFIRDQVLGELRLAQQVALAQQTANATVLTLRESDDQASWQLDLATEKVQGATTTTTALKSLVLDKEGTQLLYASSNASSCVPSVAIAGASRAVIRFDNQANSTLTHCLLLQGASATPLCVSRAGYAHEGSCVF